jgi:ABC-2 type transport system ATP-binding protein
MPDPAVQVEHLVKKYGQVTAVNDISFEVQRGEIFALLGPNGAGKTTAVEIIECLRPATRGEVKVLGKSIAEPEGVELIKKRAGILPQEFAALDRLTVRENLELFGGMYDHPVNIPELMALFGLEEKASTRFGNLSGGQKQRVGIAASLVNDPEVVFLDEPTTGLDPEVRRATWKIILDLKKKGKTIFLTTHYMEEAQELSDRIAIIVSGKIAALGTPSELIAKYGGEKAVIFRKGGDLLFGTLHRFFDNAAAVEGGVSVPYGDARDLLTALSALSERGIQAEMEIKVPRMEDVFLRVTGFNITQEGEAK